MTIQDASKKLTGELSSIYDDRESAAIADWVMENLTGWKKVERIINKNEKLSEIKLERMRGLLKDLMAHRPVQYILNEAWFNGMKLYVDENVLIPRPETEELVEWALSTVVSLQMTVDNRNIRVLDVGTGSGCIPIALKKNKSSMEVYACDISDGALAVARKNAIHEGTAIELLQLDFLNQEARVRLPLFDLILSNPPYISNEERSTIDRHVIEYEPHLALFVPADDSLIFYKHLAEFGKTHLQGGGCMMMEIHSAKAEAVAKLFTQDGYQYELRKDMHGNDRMIKVWPIK